MKIRTCFLRCAFSGLVILLPSAAFGAFAGTLTGTGFPIGGVTATDELGLNPRKLVDAIKDNLGLNEDEARARAILLEKNLCNAIDLVKLRNQAVGDCLDLLKKKGRLCVSFDAHEKCAGACRHDQTSGCSENDPITLNLKYTGTNCMPSYDPVMSWLVSTLLHEGTHAAQDYTNGVSNADADKRRAEGNLKRACNEVEAHATGTNWAIDLLAMLERALRGVPLPANTSPVMKRIYEDLKALSGTDRTNAYTALTNAATRGLRSDSGAVACYSKAKQALQAFIDADLSDPADLADALDRLKFFLTRSSWKTFVSHYETPRIVLSDGNSGTIEQVNGIATDFLVTGMRAVMDFDLSLDERTLVVSGFGQVDNTASLYVYSDNNLNGRFEPSERTVVYENNPQLRLNLSLVRHPINNTFLIYDQASQTLRRLLDPDSDGKPDSLGPVVFVTSASLQWVFRWYFDETGQILHGFPFIDNRCPAVGYDEVIAEAGDENGDGFFEQFQFVPFGQVEPVGPTWLGQVTPGQTSLLVVGQLGHPILAFALTPDHQPGELLGQLFHTRFRGDPMPLSRPITMEDRLMLLDPVLDTFSPEIQAEIPDTPPRILSGVMTPAGFRLIWTSVALRTYRIRFKTNLSDPAWDFLPNLVTASGTATFQIDPEATSAPRRFYRVEILPE